MSNKIAGLQQQEHVLIKVAKNAKINGIKIYLVSNAYFAYHINIAMDLVGASKWTKNA